MIHLVVCAAPAFSISSPVADQLWTADKALAESAKAIQDKFLSQYAGMTLRLHPERL